MAPSALKSKDLVVPYVHVAPAPEADSSAVISQSMPMAAMFMKLLSWVTLITAIQAVLSGSGQSTQEAGQSPLLRVLMAVVSIGVCYMELVVPGASGGLKKKGAEKVADNISSTIAAAVKTATK